MNGKNTIVKNLIAVLLSVSVICCNLSFLVLTKADDGITVTDNKNPTKELSESLIYGTRPIAANVYVDGTTYDFSPNGNIVRITDGITTAHVDIDIGTFKKNDGTLHNQGAELEVYDDFVYQLSSNGMPATISEIYYASPEGQESTHKYEIYVGDDRSKLGTEETLVSSYTNSAAASGQLFTFSKEVKGIYVMLRITMGIQLNCTHTPNVCYARVREFAVFGTVPPAEIEIENNKLPTLDFSQSLIYGTRPIAANVYVDGTTYDFSPNGNIVRITDGITTAHVDIDIGTFKKNDGSLRNQGAELEVYDDFVYQLSSNGMPATISEIYYASPEGQESTHKYEIYVGDDRSKLGTEETLVSSYTNSAAASGQLFTFSKEVKGIYVMLRITMGIQPNCTHTPNVCYARVREFSVFGTVPPAEIEIENNKLPTKELSESLIYGTRPLSAVINNSGASVNFIVNPNVGYITDGDTTKHIDVDPGKFKNSDGTLRNQGSELEVYDDFVYQLSSNGMPATISEIYYASPEGQESTHKYEIYVSDDRSKLGTEESLVSSYTNSAAASGQLFTFNKEVKGIYVMLRITMGIQPSCTHTPDVCYARVREFAVFGTVAESDVVFTNNAEPTLDLTKSLIYGINPYRFVITDKGESYDLSPNPTRSNITDGTDNGIDCSWGDDVGTFKNSDGTLRNQGSEKELYLDVVYQIGLETAPTTLDEVYIKHSEGNVSTYKYELHISDKVEELGTADTLIGEYTNIEAAQSQLITFNKEYTGCYIMYRITMGIQPDCHHTPNICYARIKEFAVYGTSKSNATTELLSRPENGNKYFEQFGESLIDSKIATMKQNGISRGTSFEHLTDGNFMDHVDYSAYITTYMNTENEYIDAIYRLGEEPMQMNSFIYAGCSSSAKGYYTGRYQIFMAVDIEDLFLEENMVYEYNYRVTGIAPIQRVTWNSEKPIGCYVAIRFLESVTNKEDWIYLRTAEFAVYGEKAVLETTPVNIAENMPIEAYLTDKNGNLKNVDDENLTPQEVIYMSDSDVTTSAIIKTGKEGLEIIYNLCQNARVYGIELKVGKGIDTKGMRVYASTDLNKIWNESTLLYKQKNSGNISVNFGEDNPTVARYIRFSVPYGNGREFDITDVTITGMSDQLLKNRSIMPFVDISNHMFFESNLKTGEVNYLTLDSSEMQLLFNGDSETAANIYGGECGVTGLNILVALGDLRNVNRLKMDIAECAGMWTPEKVKIYAGSTINEVMGENRIPIAEFSGEPENDCYDVLLNPTLMRYVCVSFEEMCKEYYIDEKIAVPLTEINVFATNVKGMNTSEDNDALYSFEDEETGIKWEVVRTDLNDVYTKIYSSKLVKTMATKKQKLSLRDISYKMCGDYIYTVEFYDVTGEKITDLDERTVRVSYPIPKDKDPYTTLISQFDGDMYNVVNTVISVDEKYVCAEITDVSKLTTALTELCDYNDPYWLELEKYEDSTPETGDDTPIFVYWIAVSVSAVLLLVSNYFLLTKKSVKRR